MDALNSLVYRLRLLGDHIVAIGDNRVVASSPRGAACYTIKDNKTERRYYDDATVIDLKFTINHVLCSDGSVLEILNKNLEVVMRIVGEKVIRVVYDRLILLRALKSNAYRLVLNDGTDIVGMLARSLDIYEIENGELIVLAVLFNGSKKLVKVGVSNETTELISTEENEYHFIGNKYYIVRDRSMLRIYKIRDNKIALVVNNGTIEIIDDRYIIRDNYSKQITTVGVANKI